MSDTEPVPGFSDLIQEAKEGRLGVVELDPEQFARIDHECDQFLSVIRRTQRALAEISSRTSWGFGDTSQALTSAQTIARRLSEKAAFSDSGNDFHSVLDMHARVVEDIRDLHAAVRGRISEQDSQWRVRFETVLASLNAEGCK